MKQAVKWYIRAYRISQNRPKAIKIYKQANGDSSWSYSYRRLMRAVGNFFTILSCLSSPNTWGFDVSNYQNAQSNV